MSLFKELSQNSPIYRDELRTNSSLIAYDQQGATILVYLFIPNQLYMFRAMSSPIIRST